MNHLNSKIIYQIKDIRKNISSISTCSGVYKIFIDKEGLKFLSGVQVDDSEIANDGKKVYLLYLGKSKNIKSRYMWHLGITNIAHSNILNGTLSTFRFSLLSNHETITDLSRQSELSKFMDNHLYIKYLCAKNYSEVEDKLLKKCNAPLNIKDNYSHPFVSTNRKRRNLKKQEYIDNFSDLQRNLDINDLKSSDKNTLSIINLFKSLFEFIERKSK